MTLGEAARLTGQRKRALRDRIRRGQLAVRIVGKGNRAKIRVTESALVDAGLLAPNGRGIAGAADGNVAALVDLLREQNARLAAVEDQRLQLAGQLGAAVERVRALEERMVELTGGGSIDESVARTPTLAGTAKLGLGAATVGLASTLVVRAVTAVSHRTPRSWPASLGSLIERGRRGI
jgi:hypothetical protein